MCCIMLVLEHAHEECDRLYSMLDTVVIKCVVVWRLAHLLLVVLCGHQCTEYQRTECGTFVMHVRVS